MRNSHVFCDSMHQRVPRGKQNHFKIPYNLVLSVSGRVHAQLLNTHPITTHVCVPHGRNNWYTSIYIWE